MIKKDHKKILQQYKETRALLRRVQNSLFYGLPTTVMIAAAKKLGMWQDGLVCENETEKVVMMDYAIYDVLRSGHNAVERYAADNSADLDDDEAGLLAVMRNSYYTVVKVLERVPGVGLRVDDWLVGEQYLLVDMNFSKTATIGAALALRILPFEDFRMSTGAALPVSQESLIQMDTYLDSHFPRPSKLDGKQRAKMAAMIINTCLDNGASSWIGYE